MGQSQSSQSLSSNQPFDSELLLDDTLTPFDETPLDHAELKQDLDAVFNRTTVATSNFIRTDIPKPKKKKKIMYHKNMIHYLALAWSTHSSVVLSPDMVFYTLLAELADEIKSNPTKFSEIFTKTPDQKKVINVVTSSPEEMDIAELVSKIQKELPIDGSIFTANFSTSTPESLLAINSAFADAVSPFYEYMSTMCGIPRVRRLGTRQDWESIESKISEWIKLIDQKAKDAKSVSSWLNQAKKVVRMIYTRHDTQFWSNMFSICNCFSGHHDDAQGWIVGLLRSSSPASGRWMYHGPTFYYLPSHISTVNWSNLETNRKFSLYTGLFWSSLEYGESELDAKYPYMLPHFAHGVVEHTAESEKDSYKKYLAAVSPDIHMWILAHQQYSSEPIMIDQGPEGIKTRRRIVAEKFHRFKIWAKAGENPEAYKNLLMYSLASDLVLSYDDKWPESSEAFQKEQPELYDAIQAMLDFIHSHRGIEHADLTASHAQLAALISRAVVGHPTVKSLRIYLSSDAKEASILGDILESPACNLERLKISCYNCTDATAKSIEASLIKTTSPLKIIEIEHAEAHLTRGVATLLLRPESHIEQLHFNTSRAKIYEQLFNFLSERDASFRLQLFWDPLTLGKNSSKEVASLKAAYLKYLSSPSVATMGRFCFSVDPDDTKFVDRVLEQLAKIPLLELDISPFWLKVDAACKAIELTSSTLKALYYTKGKGKKYQSEHFSCDRILKCVIESCLDPKKGECVLETLDLSAGEAGPENALKLIELLSKGKAASLTHLGLCFTSNQPLEDIVEALAAYLKDSSCHLQSLCLGGAVSASNQLEILSSLKKNTSLVKLELFVQKEPWQTIPATQTEESASSLERACKSLCKRNHTLKEVSTPFKSEYLSSMCYRNSLP